MLNVEQCSMLNVEQCSMLNLDNAECLTLSLSPAWVRLGVHNDGRQDFEHLTGFIDQRCGVRGHLRLGKCDQPQPVARLRALFSRDRGLGNEVALRLTGASFLEVGSDRRARVEQLPRQASDDIIYGTKPAAEHDDVARKCK